MHVSSAEESTPSVQALAFIDIRNLYKEAHRKARDNNMVQARRYSLKEISYSEYQTSAMVMQHIWEQLVALEKIDLLLERTYPFIEDYLKDDSV